MDTSKSRGHRSATPLGRPSTVASTVSSNNAREDLFTATSSSSELHHHASASTTPHHYRNHHDLSHPSSGTASKPQTLSKHSLGSSANLQRPSNASASIDDRSTSSLASIQSHEFWPQPDSDDSDNTSNSYPKRSCSSTKTKTSGWSTSRFFRALAKRFGKSYKPRYGFLLNDAQEQDRNELQHKVLRELLDGRLHLSPVIRPARALDVGTGPGSWALDFAKRHPECDVVGIDIDPVRPPSAVPNCRFLVMDATEDWAFEEKFDFIHVRMVGDLPGKNKLIQSIFENLNPGGWVEFTEWIVLLQSPDHSFDGSAFHKWNCLLLKGLRKLGSSVFYPTEYKALLQKAGFDHVTERKHAAMTNPCYPGKSMQRLGALMTSNWMGVIEPLSVPVFASLGWSPEKTKSLLVDVRKEISDPRFHSFMTLMTVYCQKPTEE